MTIDPKLLEYCVTDRQREALQALIDREGNVSRAAQDVGMHRHHLRRAVKSAEEKAERSGYSPRHGLKHELPAHLLLKGTSALVDERSGETVMRWYKSTVDQQALMRSMVEAAQSLSEAIPREPPTPAPDMVLEDLMSTYVLTDCHLGMLSWPEETSEEWDTRIAEDVMSRWVSRALAMVPRSKRAVFCQLGDFLHYDGMDSVTPTNRNVLDADSRLAKMGAVAVRSLRMVIQSLLTHHEEVVVIMAEGNHDPASSMWLRELLTVLYEGEPRVTIDKNPLPYYCVEHGKTSVFFHHGHLRKPKEIADVFAAQFRDVFGRTMWSYAHTGHQHHSLVHETALMTIEQHQTLAARDAHSARHGYHAQRSSQVITYSSLHGEVGRARIPFSMIRPGEAA